MLGLRFLYVYCVHDVYYIYLNMELSTKVTQQFLTRNKIKQLTLIIRSYFFIIIQYVTPSEIFTGSAFSIKIMNDYNSQRYRRF